MTKWIDTKTTSVYALCLGLTNIIGKKTVDKDNKSIISNKFIREYYETLSTMVHKIGLIHEDLVIMQIIAERMNKKDNVFSLEKYLFFPMYISQVLIYDRPLHRGMWMMHSNTNWMDFRQMIFANCEKIEWNIYFKSDEFSDAFAKLMFEYIQNKSCFRVPICYPSIYNNASIKEIKERTKLVDEIFLN